MGFSRCQGGASSGFARAQGTSPGWTPAQGASSGAFTPTSISGIGLWLDFSGTTYLYQDSARSTPVTANNDPIGGVTDRSGASNHAAQATAGKRPLYKTGIQNGLSMALFDGAVGADDALTVADNSLLEMDTDSTVFVVVKSIVAANNAGIITKGNGAGVAGAYALILDNAGTGKPNVDRPWIEAGVAATNSIITNAYLISASISGTSVTHRRNGAANGTDTLATGTANNASLYIGRYEESTTTLNGHIGEVIIYNSALSAGDITLVETYLNTKWAIY